VSPLKTLREESFIDRKKRPLGEGVGGVGVGVCGGGTASRSPKNL